MVVFTLTLIRHGETSHNKDNVIQGQLDIPLSQVGIQQAELLGFHLQYQQFSHVFISDLLRAKQTADSIIRQNKSFKALVFHDSRLRERKFGNVEGKSVKFLREVAEKSNQNNGQYTPPGGETIQQVHERAVSFFKDLCQMVKESSKLDSRNDCVKSQNNSNGSQCDSERIVGQKRKWENGENCFGENDQSENVNKINSKESLKSDVTKINDSESSLCSSYHKVIEEKDNASFPNENLENACSKIDVSLLSYKKLQDPENMSNIDQYSLIFADDDIRSQIISKGNDITNTECPNVSLSPLVDQNYISSPNFHALQEGSIQHERRLSVCSSCDEADSGPTLMANVLVVSHGGWLRELLRHFVEDLECSVPGGRKQALRISPNAGLSKFTVSLEDYEGHPKIICLQIHDKQHLISSSYNEVPSDDVAL